ncbi:MAG: hypothetical protein ACON48_04690 [Chitinophagales bacterium]
MILLIVSFLQDIFPNVSPSALHACILFYATDVAIHRIARNTLKPYLNRLDGCAFLTVE